jgi:AcrR family transcriptional regulator
MATAVLDPRIERTRKVVLEAAIQVLGERGFAGASIDAIAQRCGVARSTMYRHWPQRMDLLLEAVTAQVGPIETLAVGDLREDLVEIGAHLAELLTSEPIGSVMASMILESRRDAGLDDLRRRFVGQRRQAVAQVVSDAVARGELPPGTEPSGMGNDLAAQIFFKALVLHEPIDRAWVEGHVDRWLERYGAH